MQNIQEIFARIQEAKAKMKDLRASYKEALETTPGYKDAVENANTAKEKKKQIEQVVQEQFASEITQISDLKIDIASDQELLSDIAMTQLMKGETVGVTDKYDNEYEPIFAVKFKKVT